MPLYENSQSFNMENLRNELAPNQTLSETSLREKLNHRTHASPLHDVINFNHTPLTVENPSQPKWKCLIRESYGKAPNTNDQIGLKCPIDMVIDISESPCKKFLVSNEDKENYLIMAEVDS